MHDKEKQKLSMYEAVISLLADNKDITAGIRALSYQANKLRKVVDEIKKMEKVLSSETLEKAVINAQAKDELIFTLVPVATALFNYAKEINDIALKAKVRSGYSYFIRLRDLELIDKSIAIRKLAEKHLPEVRKFNITIESLETLQTKTESFKDTLDNKISTFISSDSVLAMNDLFVQADGIVNLIDRYVEVLSGSFEEFYEEYLYTRDVDNQDQRKELMELEEDEEE